MLPLTTAYGSSHKNKLHQQVRDRLDKTVSNARKYELIRALA